MSKVLRLLDYAEKFLTFAHEDWLIEQEMKEYGNTDKENRISEKEKFDNYVNPDGNESFSHDDIPF